LQVGIMYKIHLAIYSYWAAIYYNYTVISYKSKYNS